MQPSAVKSVSSTNPSPGGYRDLFHTLEHGVVYFDAEGRILDANPAAVRILGIEISELRQRAARVLDWQAVHPDLTSFRDDQYPAMVVMRTGLPLRGVVMGLHVPGQTERRWLRIDTVPQFGETASTPCGCYAVFTDITVQHRAEEALRNSEQKLSAIFRLCPEGIVVASIDTGRIVEVNPAVCRMSGYSREELLGRTTEEIGAWCDPGQREKYYSTLRTHGKVSNFEVLLRCKSGEPIHGLLSGEVTQVNGSTHIISAFRDISEWKRVQDTLAATHRTASEIVESIPAGLFIYQYVEPDELRFVSANPAAQRLTGIREADWRGRPFNEVWPDAERHGVTERYLQVARTGQPYEEEVVDYRDDKVGGSFWMRVFTLPGQRLAVAFENTTARRQAEEDLRDTATLLRTLFDAIPQSLLLIDPAGRILAANQMFAARAGIPATECTTRCAFDLFAPSVASQQRAWVAEVLASGTTLRTEIQIGDDWMLHHLCPVVGPEGKPNRVVMLIIDTTDRRRAEAALAESTARFRDLTFIMADWVWEVDTQSRYTFVSESVQDCLGITASEMLGRTPFEFMAPEEADRVSTVFKAIAERRESFFDLDNTLSHRDGTPRHLSTSGVPILGPDGAWLGYRGCDRDVTDRKRLEQQYLRSQRFESIGALASGVAHDLNNVLAPILMAIDMLSESLTGVENRGVLEMLRTSARRGTGVVRQLLSFSRGTENQRTRLNTRYVLREIADITAETFPRSIRIDTRLGEDLWDIHADATQVHQVLLNLCVNARDAMPNGGHLRIAANNAEIDEVYARMNPDAAVGRFIRLTISDSGVGMSPELLDKIFEPFFTTKAPGQGTGLGLASVLSIVKNHGGFLEVTSRLHHGTEFRIYFPACSTQTDPDSTADSPPPIPRGSGETILVVDDESALRNIAASALVRYGYQAVKAVDGAEALTTFALNQGTIRAAVIDMNMPVMDGATTIMALRRICPSLPIIAMSGLPEQETAARKATPEDLIFLHKPFAADELLHAVAQALAAKTPASSGPLKP